MNTAPRTPHPDDGALVRRLDGQTLPGDDSGHLAACPQCQARFNELEHRSDALSGLLHRGPDAAIEPPAHLLDRVRRTARDERARHWTRTPLLKAAVIAAVLVAPLAAEPVRDWIGRSATRLATAVGLVEAPAPSGAGDAEITIVPAGNRLVIRVDAPQPEGAVVLRFEDRPDALVRVPSGSATSLVALPDGFRVINGAGGPDEYRFTVPAGLPVEVRVAGSTAVTVTGEPGTARTVRLVDGP